MITEAKLYGTKRGEVGMKTVIKGEKVLMTRYTVTDERENRAHPYYFYVQN